MGWEIFPLPLPGGSEGKVSAYIMIVLGSIPGAGRSPGDGNDNPLQHSCLVNPMDRGDWWATVHGVTKESDTTKQLTLSLSREDYSFRKSLFSLLLL